MKKCIKCGSHAFNLYAEGIDQGGFCDVHYWEGRAHRAEALAQSEQEPVAGVAYVDDLDLWHFYPMRETDNFPDGTKFYTTPPKRPWVGLTENEIEAIEEKALTKQWAIRMALTAVKEKNT